jgi:hypothetical protein
MPDRLISQADSVPAHRGAKDGRYRAGLAGRRMHDVNARLLHGTHIDCVSIQDLHNEHAKYILVVQVVESLGRR